MYRGSSSKIPEQWRCTCALWYLAVIKYFIVTNPGNKFLTLKSHSYFNDVINFDAYDNFVNSKLKRTFFEILRYLMLNIFLIITKLGLHLNKYVIYFIWKRTLDTIKYYNQDLIASFCFILSFSLCIRENVLMMEKMY